MKLTYNSPGLIVITQTEIVLTNVITFVIYIHMYLAQEVQFYFCFCIGCKENMGNAKSKGKPNKESFVSNKYKYKYKQRKCDYRCEMFEMSPNETETINKLLKLSKDNQNKPQIYNVYKEILKLNKKPIKIIIDTDIGTDIDDVLTMLQLIHMNKDDVQCIGITTNYYPTLLRKRVLETIFSNVKDNKDIWNNIPIIAGNNKLCGTHRDIFHAGNEGNGLNLTPKELKKLWKINSNSNAEDFIYKQLCQYPGEITIVSIGIPTNIGNLVNKYGKDKIEKLIGHIVVMGGGNFMNDRSVKIGCYGKYIENSDGNTWIYRGDMTQNEIKNIKPIFPVYDVDYYMNACRDVKPEVIHFFPNHNISGDTLASVMMFELECPISVIPHHITAQHILRGKAIETLLNLAKNSDVSNGKYIENENGICGVLLKEWFNVRRRQRCQCLHDPLTLYESIYIEQSNTDSNNMDSNIDIKDDNNNINDSKADDDIKSDKSFEIGKSSLKYVNGTFICHEWAGFLSFIIDKNGHHRLGYDTINPSKFVEWCGNTLINNVSQQYILTKMPK